MFHEIHQQAIYGSDLCTTMFVAVSIVSYPILNDMYNIFVYLFTFLFKRSVCHLLRCSPQYVKVLPLPWGKSTCGLLSPLISPWLFVNKWSIEAALLKWASSPELPLNITQAPSDPQFSFASLPGSSRNALLRREGDLGANWGMAGTATVTVIFYLYRVSFLVVAGNSHAKEQKKSCIFTFTARAFLGSCATWRVTSVGAGTASDQVAWGLFKAEHS